MKINWKNPQFLIGVMIFNPIVIALLEYLYLDRLLSPALAQNPSARVGLIDVLYSSEAKITFLALKIFPGWIALWLLQMKSKAAFVILNVVYPLCVLAFEFWVAFAWACIFGACV
jgi:hypothetical protein